MVTKNQLNILESIVNYNNIDYSRLSDEQLIRLHELGFKAEKSNISLSEEIEIEQILGSAASGNKKTN